MRAITGIALQNISGGFSPELAGSYMGVSTGGFIGAGIGLPLGIIGSIMSYNLDKPYYWYGITGSVAIVPTAIILGAFSGGIAGYFSGYTANKVYRYFQDESE